MQSYFLQYTFFTRNLFTFIVRDLFNGFTRAWFNCFACNYTLICLIFSEMDLTIFLTITLFPIFLLLWVYTITIDGNVCNIIEMCRIMFQICCTDFGFFMTTISMFSHVSVYVMYFFYLISVNIHNVFYLTDASLLCCTCVLEG